MVEQNWTKLTPEQKRQYKFEKFASTEAEESYKKRVQRLVDVYNIREPDMVPVSLPLGNLPCLLYGVNMYGLMYEHEKAIEAYRRFNKEYAEELEVYASPMLESGRPMELLGYKLYVWPGHGLPREAPGFQFVEGEYMRQDEYDALIRDPSDFWIRTYLPRVFSVFEPVKMTQPLTDITEIIGANQFSVLATPEAQDALQKMLDAGKEYRKKAEATKESFGQAAAHGYPGGKGVFCKAPFDIIGDTLRGTHGIMMDMYRQPDKLLKALDVIADITIASVLNSPGIKDCLIVSYPLHKGADGWMSQKQFEKFYWPSLRKVMNAFIQEGLMQSLFAEGAYNTRLETVNEFPKGFVDWRFDQTDMARAKQVLGEKCCIEGNIPSSLMVTGSPADVKEYCRKLIEVCGKGGGYILTAGATADNPKLENLRAVMAAAKEYGVYR